MYFDGVDDWISVTGMTATLDYFGSCTIQSYLYVEDTSSSQVAWSLGTGGYRLLAFGGQWWLNTTNTGVSVSGGLNHVSVDFDSSGQATELRIDGVTVWTGTAAVAGFSNTTFSIGRSASGAYFKGLIYDFSISGSSVKNFAFNGYGNTDADWTDQVGSNDGTVNGSPSLYEGRNATQSTAASQPQIVADGVVVTDANGFACVDHDGTNDGLATTSGGIVFDSIIMVGEADVTTLVTLLGNDSANLKYSLFSDGAISYCNHSSSIQYAEAVDASPAIYSTLGTDGSMRKGGVEKQTGTVGTVTGNALIGYRLASGAFNRGWNGKISEIIIYPDDRSSSIAAIEANIAARYGITI